MKAGITSCYLNRYGLEKGLERMAAHGYECMDYQELCHTETELFTLHETAFEKELTRIGRTARAAGIGISQTHGPWRYPIHDHTPEERAERWESMAKGIRGTAYLGCRYFVIHNIMPFGNDDADQAVAREMNRDHFGRLLEVAKAYGVVICMENMPFGGQGLARPADMLGFVKEMDSPFMRMCLDTGHAAVFGISPADAVRLIGKDYLATLHVHDNDGAHDCHWLPYDGVVDWGDFARALQEIDFGGTVSLETSVGNVPEEEREEKEIRLASICRQLAGK